MNTNIYHSILLISVLTLTGIQLTAQPASISGTIRRANGSPMSGVEVNLSGAATAVRTTDAMGSYLFDGLTTGESYTITPAWPTQNCFDPCYSVYDQYLITRHILGLSPLPSPYAIFAADINNSRSITNLDVIQLRSLILGNTNTLSSNTCRRFIPAEYMFPNASNPWFETIPQIMTISNLNGNAQADFIGVQTGDVSDCAETLAASDLTLIADFSGEACFNKTITVPIRVQNFNGIAALQFTLRWDPAVLTYQGVLNFGLPGLTGINFGQTTANTQNGIVTMTWVASDASGISLPDGTLLVNVFFTTVGDVGSSSSLYFGDAPLPPLAVDGMGVPVSIGVQNGLAEITGPDAIVGPTYCHNGLQFISFYTEGDVSPADGGDLIQNLGDNNYWVYAMNANDSWLFQTSDPDNPGCQRFYLDMVGTCSEALSPDCDEPLPLTDNNTDDDQMRVWGNHLVWQSFDSSDYEIFYLNLSDPAATPQAITNNAANDFRPSIWGNRIVWEHDNGSDREIRSLSLDDLAATPQNLSNDPAANDANPKIWGNFAVWNKGNDLYYHDFAKNETLLLTTTGLSNSRFSLRDNRVVWEGQGSGSQEIFAANLTDLGAGIQQLSNNTFEDADPKIHGNYVVWTGQPAGQGEIYAFELGVSVAPELISTSSASNNAPAVYGESAVWAGNDGSDSEIYRYDLGLLGSAAPEALTNNAEDDFSPAVWGKHLVWNSNGQTWYLPLDQAGQTPRNLSGTSPAFAEPPQISGHLVLWRGFDGNPEMYMYDLTLLPPAAPVLNAMASVTFVCPGDQATLVLQNIGAGYTAVWFEDEQMSNQLYANVANNYQPVIGSPATYYAAWQHPVTGCIGALTPVDLQVSATDNLACNTQFSVSLNAQCEAEIMTDLLLVGNFGCLGASDFVVVVMDGNTGNGPIVDGPGNFDYIVILAPGVTGNLTSCWGMVNATDPSPLAIECPGDQQIMAASGQNEAPAFWPDPDVTANCPATLSSTFNSGDNFPIGTTSVVYTASVGNGNTATCDFDIAVLSTIQADVSLLAGSATVEAGDQFCIPVTVNGFADLVAFQFSMNYDPALLQVESVGVFGLPDMDASNFNLTIPGVISVQWLDLTGQGISLPDGATIFQICFTAIAPGTSPIGFSNTPAAIEFIDADNIQATVTQNPGTVLINAPLVLVCPDDITIANAPGRCDAFVSVPIPMTPGPGTLTTQLGTIDASGIYPVGTTTVIYTFIGSETLTCSFTVTVLDTEPPVVDCQDVTVYLDEAGTVVLTAETLIPDPVFLFINSNQDIEVENARAMAVGDLNGDGFPDLFIVADNGSPNQVWLNNGNGFFTNSGQLMGNRNSLGVDLGDLDGDGDLDAFVGNHTGQSDEVWFNDGNGFFTNSGLAIGNYNSTGVSMSDVDNDGDLDVYVACFNGQPDRVFLNNGAGVFSGPGIPVDMLNGFIGVFGHLNGDIFVDLVVVNGDSHPNKVFFGNGTGNFTDSGQNLGTQNSRDATLGDFNGDGHLDVAICHLAANNQVWFNDGNGFFTDSGQNLGNQQYFGVESGDLDGDGDLDIVLARRGFSGGPNEIWLNNGSGTFTYSGVNMGGGTTTNIKLADVDGDGDLDGALINALEPHQVYFNISTSGMTDNCTPIENLIVEVSPDQLGCEHLGIPQTVIVTVTDEAGNSSVCESIVTVLDTLAPVIVCGADTTLITGGINCNGVSFDLPTPEATDNCPPVAITGTRDDGLPLGDVFPPGTTCVLWIAEDEAGNRDSCTMCITVELQGSPPQITCLPDVQLFTDPGLCENNSFVMPDPTVLNDPCATVLGVASQPGANGPYPKGVQTFTFYAQNDFGIDSCNVTVTVSDAEPPTLICPPDVTVNANLADGGAVVVFGDFQAGDNCPETILNCSHQRGDVFPCGETTVNCVLTDMAGNTMECGFIVTVICLAPEDCGNGVDDDGDGLIDAFDPDCPCDPAIYGAQCDPDCEYDFVDVPIEMEEKWVTAEDVAVYQTPMVGDIDADGIPEVIILSTNAYNSNPRTMRDFRVFDGQTGIEKLLIPTVDGAGFGYDVFWDQLNTVAIANVDADLEAEIFVVSAQTTANNASNNSSYIFCYEHDGTLKWKSNMQYGYATFPGRFGSSVGIADFNGDGIPEVYIYDQIFNAQTGVLLASGNNDNGIARAGFNNQNNVATRAHPIAADLTDHPGLELACGRTVYELNLVNTSGTAGNTMTPINAPAVAFGFSAPSLKDGFTSLADIDADGAIDVLVSWVDPTSASSQQALVYVWNPRTASIIAKTDLGTTSNVQASIGVAFVGDMDNDCEPEIGICRPGTLFALEYNGTNTLVQKWALSTTDSSGLTGLTLFDFNQDGKAEIVYRDQDNLRIIDGSSSTPVNLAQINCYSSTGSEMPVVADVDGDSYADICLTCANMPSPGADRGKVRVISSGGQPWAPTRPVWNQNAYHVFNINDDLSVPLQPSDNAVTLSVAECNDVCNRPYNNFLQQATYLTQEGCPTFPAPDATVTLLNVMRVCPSEVNFQFFVNNVSADAPLPAGLPVTFYIGDPMLPGAVWMGTVTLPNPIPPLSSSPIDMLAFLGVPSTGFTLFAVVNDDNSQTPPLDFPITNIPECDYTNNLDSGFVEDCDCVDFSLIPIPTDTSNNNCCWTLDYANAGTQEVWAVQLIALDGVTMHYTLSTGYTGIGSETDLSIISTSFGPLPASVDGLMDLCLGHISAVPQTLVVHYKDNMDEIICTDTLRFSCPPEEACLYILTDSLVCDSLGYKYTAVVKNPIGSDFEVGFVKFNITPSLPGGVTYNPGTEFILTPKLAPGESTTIMFTIETGLNLFGDSLCFILSAHDDERERLCCAEIDACVPFPQCDPCEYADVEVQPVETPGDTCCYELLLSNTHPAPGYFTQVQTTILTPGAYFTSVDLDFIFGWWYQDLSVITSQTDDLLWNHTSSAVPQMSDFNLFDFCIAGVTTTDSVYIQIAWISGDSVLCIDSVAVWCPACVVVAQDTVVCNPDGTYTYTFSGENWSDYSVNAIGFVEVGTGFNVTPEVIPLSGLIPPYPSPGNTFGPVSVTITTSGAVPGDTICIDLVLRQVLNDSVNILCCYVTHCIILPECGPQGQPCPDIECTPPPDVEVSCSDLPQDLDVTNSAALAVLFGAPDAGLSCPGGFTWDEFAPISNLSGCVSGTIIRQFTVSDGFGNTSNNICRQTITVTQSPGRHAIRFPADATVDCAEADVQMVEVQATFCDLIAVGMSDEIFAPTGNECYKIFRTYRVINWCVYDGTSPPQVVSRDEDCNGISGDNGVWVIVQPGAGTYYDSDDDENNGIPAAGTRSTACDGLSNPAGHWVNSTIKPAIASMGFWEYTQHIDVVAGAPPVIVASTPGPYCIIENQACAGPVNFPFQVENTCPPRTLWAVIDLDNDGMNDAVVQLNTNGTLTTLLGPPGYLTITGVGPGYAIAAGAVPMGTHGLQIQAEDGCGNTAVFDAVFEMEDCTARPPICINGLSATILGFVDTDGDGSPDQPGIVLTPDLFLASASFDCSQPLTYSINLPGTTPSPTQTSIILTCSDLGTVALQIHAWDAAGNHDFCETFAILQDNSGLCPVPPPGDGGIRIFPNPADREIWVEIPPGNWRDLGLLDAEGAVLQTLHPGLQSMLRVDTERLSSGLYLLRLRGENGELRVARFVRR